MPHIPAFSLSFLADGLLQLLLLALEDSSSFGTEFHISVVTFGLCMVVELPPSLSTVAHLLMFLFILGEKA